MGSNSRSYGQGEMRTPNWVLIGGVVLALAATAGAQTFVRSAPRVPPGTEGAVPNSPATNALIGTARDAGDDLLGELKVQLRDLQSGTVKHATTTNADGTFAFRGIEPGTYVVEAVLADGAVAAISEATTVGSGEVVQTLVRLTSRTRAFGWWAGSTANSVVAQAAGSGVLAVEPGVPISPQ